jgi:segregation and condensation protein A
MSFKEFAGDAKEKVEVIVSFLALLELVKQGAVDVLQHETFGDIRIENTSTEIPKYG